MKHSKDIAQLYKMLTDDIDRQNPAAAGPTEPCSGFSDRRLVEVFRRDLAARPAPEQPSDVAEGRVEG